MKTVISVRDLEEMVRSGKDVRSFSDDVILTPSARDFLHDLSMNGNEQAAIAPAKTAAPTTNGKPRSMSAPAPTSQQLTLSRTTLSSTAAKASSGCNNT